MVEIYVNLEVRFKKKVVFLNREKYLSSITDSPAI